MSPYLRRARESACIVGERAGCVVPDASDVERVHRREADTDKGEIDKSVLSSDRGPSEMAAQLARRASDGEQPQRKRVRRDPNADAPWTEHYFGGTSFSQLTRAKLTPRADIVVQGYTSYRESTFCTLVTNEAVSLARIPPPPGKKSKDDSIVRFKNSKGVEVGRIVEHEAIWICKLLDLGMATFTGTAIVVPRKFQSGTTCPHGSPLEPM